MKKCIRNFVFIAVIVMTAFYVSTHYYQVILIEGYSMFPTYHNYQFALIDLMDKTYVSKDVIAIKSENLHNVLVKRIVGCPGDRLVIKDHHLFINGINDDTYNEHVYFDYAGILDDEIYLYDDEYFVIGDNIQYSKDSRFIEVGVISRKNVIGKIIPQKAFDQEKQQGAFIKTN